MSAHEAISVLQVRAVYGDEEELARCFDKVMDLLREIADKDPHDDVSVSRLHELIERRLSGQVDEPKYPYIIVEDWYPEDGDMRNLVATVYNRMWWAGVPLDDMTKYYTTALKRGAGIVEVTRQWVTLK